MIMDMIYTSGEALEYVDGYEVAFMLEEFSSWQEAKDYCETYPGFTMMEPRTSSLMRYAILLQKQQGEVLFCGYCHRKQQ